MMCTTLSHVVQFLFELVKKYCNLLTVATRIPFSSIHKDDLPFSSEKRKCFQPGRKIFVKVLDIEIPDTSRLINPNVYVKLSFIDNQ